MSDRHPSSLDALEQARDLVWDALQKLEAAQRVLFRAGDRYVADVWGDGVRAILEMTERITDLTGEVSSAHIEIGRLARRDRDRDRPPKE